MLLFRTIWSKTLRDYRYAILGWGSTLGLFVLITMVYYSASDEGARAAEAEYANLFRFLGEPVAITTPAGYTTWHTVAILPVMLSIWTVLAGSWLVRGDEERGSLDLALVTPHSRVRVLLEKIAAFVTALALITLIVTIGTVLGELGSSTPVSVSGALLMSLNVTLAALVFGMLAMLLSQLFARRATAAGWAGALVIASYLLNGTGRILDHGEWLQRLTPLYYHDLSKPLIPGYGTNIGAMLLLAGLCVALGGAGVALFVIRDVGGTAFSLPHLRLMDLRLPWQHTANNALQRAREDVFVRSIGLRAMRAEMATVGWWLFTLLVTTVWITLLARTTKDAVYKILQGTPGMAQILAGFDVRSDNGFVAAVVFFYLPVLVALFAMMLAMTWPNDLERGRVELGLTTPLPRWRIYLERFGAAFAAMLLAPLVTGLTIFITALFAGLTLDTARLPAAMLGLLALELITAAAIYIVAGWLRSAAVAGIAGVLIGVSYFAELLNPLLKLPEWVITLSIFHHFGRPLTQTPFWGDWLVITIIAAIFLVLGAFRFTRSDVRSGT